MKDEDRRMQDEGGRMIDEGPGMRDESSFIPPSSSLPPHPSSLSDRTRAFAVRVIRLYCALPKSTEAQVIGKQLLRAGTSVGAHYREAIRARSDAEFISKLEGGLQELEETRYWLELLRDVNIMDWSRLSDLDHEADELTRILVTVVKQRKHKRMKDEG